MDGTIAHQGDGTFRRQCFSKTLIKFRSNAKGFWGCAWSLLQTTATLDLLGDQGIARDLLVCIAHRAFLGNRKTMLMPSVKEDGKKLHPGQPGKQPF